MGQLIFQATLGGTTALVGPNTTATNSLTIPNASGALAWSTSALTSGRVPYAGTGGLLQDSANMNFDGSTLTTLNSAYTGTLTGGTGVVNLGSGQFYKDASGNVGIGTNNPSAAGKLAVLSAVGQDAANFTDNINYTLKILSGGVGVAFVGGAAGSQLALGTNGSEKVRIDSSGNLLVGTTNTSSVAGIGVKITGASTDPIITEVCAATTSAVTTYQLYSTGASAFRFYVGAQGQVYATNTTISAISDQRYKENVVDLDVGLDAVMALKPRKFDWKQGKGKDIKGDRGFIAQEFETIFPDLIDEWKDPAPEGEEPYKSVRQDLIPVLVKAIQELNAKVTALENK
jgi:hypothetical protein